MKSQTLREIAVTQPGATSVFLARGLDFCCGGGRTLADACLEKGLDPDAVASAILANALERGDLTKLADLSLPELTSLIETRYHARLRADLPELIVLAAKVERVHAEKASCPKGLAGMLRQLEQGALEHLAKEEQVLFPMIRAGHGSRANGPVEVMEREHEDHGRALASLRAVTADFMPPPDACTTWKALYLRLQNFSDEFMEHIHLENNILFPRALCEEMEAS